ncbi:hypothetical protein ASG17_05550 [Brevundimonas sp. Leaf363]|uniref:fasciclin domain-containing protein n=1 Tax=Brevundimonas sp. Leaf363 TaxID=1736353 RepID=UPI0006F79FCE|nr:fasciclin domain-containing protein [Brevundimonas sp. Leaf363]KQS55542.1 hypothetical protein ASG17_05550 [Brevundimonas sp. Leaf363]
MTRAPILLAVLCALAACEREAAPSQPSAPPVAQPQPTSTVWGGMTARPDLTTFTDSAAAAGAEPLLRSGGPWTVFAPTNDAFAKLPVEQREPLLKPENRDALRALITYHIIPGRLTTADLAARATAAGGVFDLTTVEGGALKVAFRDGRLTIMDGSGAIATIAEPDEASANGVFHTLGTALQKNSPSG